MNDLLGGVRVSSCANETLLGARAFLLHSVALQHLLNASASLRSGPRESIEKEEK